MKEYSLTAFSCFRKDNVFLKTASNIKWKYVLFHFALVLCLLYLPVFFALIKTQPDELYGRMYSVDMDRIYVEKYENECFRPERIKNDLPTILIFDDIVVYADNQFALSAPTDLIFSGGDNLPARNLFGMIAVYNRYVTQFLLPVLLISFLILVILQVLFFLIAAIFCAGIRFKSASMEISKCIKAVVLCSFWPAVLCLFIGFALPTVHIVLFQIINLATVAFAAKQHEKAEEDMYSCS